MRAVRSEWTKLRTVPSTGWLLLAIVGCTVVATAATVASVSTTHCPTPAECFEDTTKLSLTGVWLGQAAVVALAVLAITSEYGTRTIQTTLAANPHRLGVLATKAAVVVGLVLPAGAVGVLGSLLVGRVILPGNGFNAANGYPPLSLADGPTLRAAAGTVLYFGLVALLSLGIGTMIRDTAGAITAALTLLYVAPIVTQLVSDPEWSERLKKLAPMTAGLAIQATTALDRLPIGPWPGLGVLAGYAAAAMIAAGAVLRTRNA